MLSFRPGQVASKFLSRSFSFLCLPLVMVLAGCGATSVSEHLATATVTMTASTTSIAAGASATLQVAATNDTQLVLTGSDGTSYPMPVAGGSQAVKPTSTTTYTASAAGAANTATAQVTVTVTPVTGANPPTVTISANPPTITAGGSSTLTIAATNATTVTVTGTDGSSYTLSPSGATQAVTPTATTTYTATATSTSGSATASTIVTVTPVATAPAPTVTLTPAPASITAGGTSTLTAVATNATSLVVTGTDGSSYTLAPTGGTQTVTPTATTTYTATAKGAGGTITATAIVNVTAVVTPPATVSISANPASITAGASSVLTITATNATSILVTGSDNSSRTLPGAGGSITVTPQATTTYTANATGAGASASQQVTITVTPSATAPTVKFTANPASIPAGASSVLTATATNATGVVITGSDGKSYTLGATGGSQTVTPASTTTYTATATGAGGSATASTVVTVVVPAPTVTINANPASILKGASSALTITATNATQITVTGTDGFSTPILPPGGTLTVTPTATTTYTATATGQGGTITAQTTVTVTVPAPTVSIAASPNTIVTGASSTLTVTATNATSIAIKGSDGTSYSLTGNSGTQVVTPTVTTTYTATATGSGGTGTGTAIVTVTPAGSIDAVQHVVFMLQENHSFDNYFGMLNPYRAKNGWNKGDDGVTYNVDGIDDKLNLISNQTDADPKTGAVQTFPIFKLTSTCVDDLSSSWLESYGDISRYDFSLTRPLSMDGFVHTAEGYAATCLANRANGNNSCSGDMTDPYGQRAMGYYDEGFLNYYYYMASQFAVSDRWFSPMSSKSIPNRIATFTGGSTEGLAFDPGADDKIKEQLVIPTIFQELTNNNVPWKIYYSLTQGNCSEVDGDCLQTGANALFPDTIFSYLRDSANYLYTKTNPGDTCAPGLTSSKAAVKDPADSFCIDLSHIVPFTQYVQDAANNVLPAFSFIEAEYGHSDEHPGSGQSILNGQAQVASVVSDLMNSPSWSSSIFFLAYDEGGGPYDHVPAVQGHSNSALPGATPVDPALYPIDIKSIAVNADSYFPCKPNPNGIDMLHCDLNSQYDPGANATETTSLGPGQPDAAYTQGFAAQLGFRVPNIIISPFTRKHYVGHTPMDHTAILHFVEDRFIPGGNHYLTPRDAAQPNLLDFFDFTNKPWLIPPTNIPTAQTNSQATSTLGYDPCRPTNYHP